MIVQIFSLCWSLKFARHLCHQLEVAAVRHLQGPWTLQQLFPPQTICKSVNTNLLFLKCSSKGLKITKQINSQWAREWISQWFIVSAFYWASFYSTVHCCIFYALGILGFHFRISIWAQLALTADEKGEPGAGPEIKVTNCPPSLIHICRFPVVDSWISAPLPSRPGHWKRKPHRRLGICKTQK